MERVLAQMLSPAATTVPEERALATTVPEERALAQMLAPAASTLPEERALAEMLAPVAGAQLESMSPPSTVVSMEMGCDSEFTESSVPGMYSWELSHV